MAKINKITLDGLEYEIEDFKAQEKLIELENKVDSGSNLGGDLMIETTWKDLKDLRDNSKLVPNQKYRIIDYVTTTSQENTQSAGHQFDIIVEALSENILSEDAKAIRHEGDTYFEDSKLEAWELKYCLDNDTSRFAWANDSSVGENTFNTPFLPEYYIYVDEAGNNSDYTGFKSDDYFVEYGYATTPDGLENQLCIFKNELSNPNYLPGGNEEGTDYSDRFFYWGTEEVDGILYDKWRKTEGSKWCSANFANDENYYGIYILTKQVTIGTFQEDTHDSSSVSIKSDLVGGGGSIGRGVIYYMKDEFNNECPYDFKNIMFIRYELSAPTVGGYSYDWQNRMSENINKMFEDNQLSYLWHGSGEYDYYWEDDMTEVMSSPTGEKKAFFTFSNVINDVVTDKSKTYNCFDNIIKECYYGANLLTLNNIVFLNSFASNNCYCNSFGNNCYNNSFSNSCYNNSFGNNCYCNSFGNNCYCNSFGNNCSYNSFGNNCYCNSFGNNCYCNSSGNNCESNSFGNNCYCNSSGNNCGSNSFGNNCYCNSFGNSCGSNSFDSYCFFNSFGNYCSYNSFGNYCYYNSSGNNCGSNSFGNDCYSNGFFDGGSYIFSNDVGEYLCEDAPLDYVQHNKFGDGCSNLLIYNDGVVGPDESIQNLNIAQGFSSINLDTANGVFYPEVIKIDTVGQDYEIKIARNSKGEIKIYCEADLIG